MRTLCKHCLNSCKIFTPNCPKYKTEDITQTRKTYTPENRKKIDWLDYGINAETK